MSRSIPALIVELRRRKVTRVAIVYAAIGLGVAEGAQMLVEALQLPDWGWRLVTILLLCGFPVALVLAWAVEVTPEGIVREREPEEAPGGEFPRAPGRMSHVLAEVGAVAVLGLMAYLLFFRVSEVVVDSDLVAVDVFENETGDASLDALGRMAADEITNALLESGLVRVVSMESVLNISRGATAAESAGVPPGINELRRETGAGLIVSGSYAMLDDRVRVRAEIVNGATGEVVAVPPAIVVTRDEMLGGTGEISQATVTAIAQLRNARLGDLATTLSLPRSYVAYESYSTGMDAFLDTEYQLARRAFERALVQDSTYSAARLYLAVTLRNLGELELAESHLAIVERDPTGLSPLMRAFAELQRAWFDGDYEAAYRAVRRGTELAVSGNWAYQLAFEANRLNHPREALEVLTALDPEGADLRGWSPYWSRLTDAHHALGEYDLEFMSAREAVRLFPESVPMEALRLRAMAAMGRTAEIVDAWPATMRRWQSPNLALSVADELRVHGSPDAADLVVEDALSWLRSLPPQELSTPARRLQVASCLYALRRWSEADDLVRELATAEPETATLLGTRGVLAARTGDVEAALRLHDRLAAFEAPYLLGNNTLWRARISAVLGRTDEAVALLRQAHEEGRGYSVTWHRLLDFESLRGTDAFETFMTPTG